MPALATVGRFFFGVALIGFGVLHVLSGDLVTRVAPGWPDWIPARTFWAWLTGVGMMAAGTALLLRWRTALVATWVGGLLLLSFVCLGLPLAATDPAWGGLWTVAGKVLALAGGAMLVAQSASRRAGRPWPTPAGILVERLFTAGPWFFGAFLALCGIQHFVHEVFVASLVPAWIPGAIFWTYFTGIALIAGGVGVVVPATARLAGLLTGTMILIWVIVLHVPRAIEAASRGSNETTAVFEAIAMSGIGFLVADVRRNRARHEVRNREVQAAG